MNSPEPQAQGRGDRVLVERMRVVDRRDGLALLQGERPSACGACAVKSACGAGALASLGSGRERAQAAGSKASWLVAPAPAPEALRVGEEVEVALSGEAFLRLAALAYLLPPTALAATAALGAAAGLSDGATALLCAPALALSLAPLWRAERGGALAHALRVAPARAAATATSRRSNPEQPQGDDANVRS